MSETAKNNNSGERLNKRWDRPGERERSAQQNRDRWADPDYNSRVSKAISDHHNQPASKKFLSETAKRRWIDPRYRDRVVTAMLESHRTPSYRVLMSAIRTAQWKNPIYRARGLAAIHRRIEHQRQVMLNKWAIIKGLQPKPVIIRPPLTTQEPKRVFKPEPSRGFSMFDEPVKLPQNKTWKRLDW